MPRTPFRGTIGLGLTLAFPSVGAASAEIDRWIESEMRLNEIPGLSMAVVQVGTAADLRAYGVRSASSGWPMTVQTPVELASVSKALTALAILHLEAQGVVSRESAAAQYLPELAGERWQGVTVSHLLRHRSGLRRRHDFLVPCCQQREAVDLETAAFLLAEADLASSPGERFAYANSNYVLLASLVQRVSDAGFAHYLREAIFARVGMGRTTVLEREARVWGTAAPHEWQWGRVRVSPSRFLGWPGSSRVRSSARDMGRYMTALLDSSALPAAQSSRLPPWWGRLVPAYDLGWTVSSNTEWLDGQLVLEHTGSLWGADTAVVLAPAHAIGAAVLINMGGSRAGEIARALVRNRVGSPLPEPRRGSRLEMPDFWAKVFLAAATAIWGVLLPWGLRLRRQFRQGARRWCPEKLRIVRSAALAIMALALATSPLWRSGPPSAALPTTIQTAIPTLSLSISALLASAAAAGLIPPRIE